MEAPHWGCGREQVGPPILGRVRSGIPRLGPRGALSACGHSGLGCSAVALIHGSRSAPCIFTEPLLHTRLWPGL